MKHENDVKQRALAGMIWKLLEKVGYQVISIVVQIILARILLPSDYGLIGYLTVFIAILDIFIQQGFSSALIQKEKIDDVDCSSVFYANIVLSIVLYGAMYLCAPLIADFFSEEKLILIARVLSLNVIIGSLGAVHNALLSKELDFKKSFFRSLSNVLTYGLVGIVLAKNGFGVWSLVFAKLIGQFVGSATLWITVNWHPTLDFSINRLNSLFRFSSKLLGTNLLNTIFNNINSLIIGRYYTPSDLGYFQRGQSIPQAMMTSVDGSMTEVMYPTFSLLQTDLVKLKSALRRSMTLSMYVCAPLLIGLIVVAKPLTLFLLTDKWIESVPYMQLTCVICLFWPLSARTHALNALGKSGLTFKLSLVSKLLTLIFLILLVKFGVLAIMYGTIASSLICFFIVSYFVDRIIGYSLVELIKDIMPGMLASVVMGIIVYSITLFDFSPWLTLLIQIPLGILIYIAESKIFKIDSFSYILSLIEGYLKNEH